MAKLDWVICADGKFQGKALDLSLIEVEALKQTYVLDDFAEKVRTATLREVLALLEEAEQRVLWPAEWADRYGTGHERTEYFQTQFTLSLAQQAITAVLLRRDEPKDECLSERFGPVDAAKKNAVSIAARALRKCAHADAGCPTEPSKPVRKPRAKGNSKLAARS